MFEAKDILEMRSNKVWDEETAERAAGLPGLVQNNNGPEFNERMADKVNFVELPDKKTDGDAHAVGSLAAAEAVQAATDERRGKVVVDKSKDRE